MKKLIGSLLALLLALGASPLMAQTLTGTVTGTITDEQGGALPGVNVSLVGKATTKTAVTDGEGEYRFVGVDPGTYTVRAELSGFRAKQQSEVAVNIGRTATVNLALGVGGIAETVDVIGEAPVVDVTSSATDATLDQSMLFNMPIRPDNAATDLLNYLPGINAGSAYGGDSDTANGLLLDGVDTRDPEGGSAWTFFNFNIVEEIQVSGLGAPAEFGAFTGAVVNSITKSGGNSFEGLFDVYYTKDSLSSDNADSEITSANPLLGEAAVTNKRLDYTAQLSGPIQKDKLFFFASIQRFELDEDPVGPRTIRHEVSPRFNVKLNWLPTANDSVQVMFQEDMYNVIGRPGVNAFLASDVLTNREDAPELVWGAQWRHLFGSSTFAEVKYTGWTGYFDLNPEVNAPGHFDAGTGEFSVSQGWFYYADRGRHQVNASVSHYAEGWGKHDLKFGVEIERSRVRSQYGYVNDLFYYDYAAYYPVGQYTAYNYGYDVEGRNRRESAFVQDSWKVNDRLTINPGLRLDWVRGHAPALNDEKVYDTKNLAPRLGFAFDLTGDSKTVLKGHYGQYYEGAFFLAYSPAVPGIEDFVLHAYDPDGDVVGPNGNRFTEYARFPNPLARVDPDIKHPRVDEFTLGVDRALTNDLRLSVVGVYREDKNLQSTVLPSARWVPIQLDNGLTGQPITVYEWANPDDSENDLLITNPDGFQFRDPDGNVLGTAEASRTYKALMLTLDKRFSDRWQGRVSYVLAKAEGTVDNSGFDSYGSSVNFETPTRALVNHEGSLFNDPRHELKVFASWMVPVIEANLSGYWRSVSGQTYHAFQRFSSRDINYTTTGREVFLEPRGSRREDMEHVLDLRAEKIFRIGDGDDRLAVYADIRNALNANHVNAVQSRFPDRVLPGLDEALPFDAPLSIESPRLILVGARWSF